MPSLGELKVWIESDGITLEEYATETLEKEATCFISSVTGQIFSIGCHNSSHQDVVIQIRVDGQIIGASICYKKTNVIKKGVDISSTSYRPFVFGKLDVTDDDAMKDKSKWQNLGCIEIIVLRVNAIAPSSIAVADMTSKFKAVPVHERSKKAGTHRVELGLAQTRAATQFFSVDYIDTMTNPYATFKFTYRPQSLLQAQGIMPPPGPEPSSESLRSRETEEVSQEPSAEDRALAEQEERMRFLQAELDKVKAEVEAKRLGANVKREASPIRIPSSGEPSRKRRRIATAVIDLTSDTDSE